MGIRAVPTFVIDGRVAVQGAQPPESLVDVLRRAAATAGPAADACGPDGCEI